MADSDAEVRTAPIEAFAQSIQDVIDPSKVDMHYFRTQTSRKSHESPMKWARHMEQHEDRLRNESEKVYLVVSDLRIKISSQDFSNTVGRQAKNCTHTRNEVYLPLRQAYTLHEKHWAIEVDGVYYELIQRNNVSKFSSDVTVERNDRHTVARIFLGITHCRHDALKEIGQAVIATQTRYELTRSNCHRFVRIVTALALCPNHAEDTIPSLPFDIEEQIATKYPNQKTGMAGAPFVSGFWGRAEDDRHRASRLIGEGVEWVYVRNNLGTELRRTIRKLHQKTEFDGDGQSQYIDEFSVYQEQTSYFIEPDPNLLDQAQDCNWLDRSPYLSLIRFDKSTKYNIIPKTTREGYKPRGSAHGMIAGPYGVTLSDESLKFIQLKPTVLIRNKSRVWRTGNGDRLEKPTSSWGRIRAELVDFFGRANSRKFKYRLPTVDLLEVVGLWKIPEVVLGGSLKWYAAGACGIAAVTLQYLAGKVRDRSVREYLPERRAPPESREPLYEVYKSS